MDIEIKKIYAVVRNHYRFLTGDEQLKLPKKEDGFAILHEPVHFQPSFLLIGESPAPEEYPDTRALDTNYCSTRDSFLPTSTHRYAFTAQALFAQANAYGLLQTCQSTDANFFRSKNFQSRDDDNFCFDLLEEIIHLLEPSKIVVTGQESYKKLARAADLINIPRSIPYGCENENPFNCPLFVVPHFSRRYSRDANSFREIIKPLKSFLES